MTRAEEKTPYIVVSFQECERMNTLTNEIRRSLKELDLGLKVNVTKKGKDDLSSPPREGAHIHGLFTEGARWDTQTSLIQEARLKELTPSVPVVFVRAIPVDKLDMKNMYPCPLYKTRLRGPTFVWTFNLKTKEKPARWILAGVALLLAP